MGKNNGGTSDLTDMTDEELVLFADHGPGAFYSAEKRAGYLVEKVDLSAPQPDNFDDETPSVLIDLVQPVIPEGAILTAGDEAYLLPAAPADSEIDDVELKLGTEEPKYQRVENTSKFPWALAALSATTLIGLIGYGALQDEDRLKPTTQVPNVEAQVQELPPLPNPIDDTKNIEIPVDDQTSDLNIVNNDVLWIDYTDEGVFLRANISDPRYQANGVGVGNLVAALYSTPNLNLLTDTQVIDLVVNSDLKGKKYSSPEVNTLVSFLEQQELKGEVLNANARIFTDPTTYQTKNILVFHSDASFLLDDELLTKLGLDYPKKSVGSATPSIEQIIEPSGSQFESQETGMLDSIDSQIPTSAYASLQIDLRLDDSGTLIHYANASVDSIAATYNLVKSVAAGEMIISESEKKQLAIDAYNLLGDRNSQYFLAISDIKDCLGVNMDLRKEAVAYSGVGRREQIHERATGFESIVASSYQHHLENSNGNPDNFDRWIQTMRNAGADPTTITDVLTSVIEPKYLKLG